MSDIKLLFYHLAGCFGNDAWVLFEVFLRLDVINDHTNIDWCGIVFSVIKQIIVKGDFGNL